MLTNDALHHDLNVPHVTDEIRRLSQNAGADRMEEHLNVRLTSRHHVN